ncbi:hypothetical protein CVT24_012867 [Panaeolus cyanescens]|uniref:Uncharacterized protein n=1 Tax=Panaeolus cyanescens TaxID=181874 RepID=A0A409X4J2_9AGAR|nr:hypothetical protein CVT24_012867 [Panaeolus cyanescens]
MKSTVPHKDGLGPLIPTRRASCPTCGTGVSRCPGTLTIPSGSEGIWNHVPFFGKAEGTLDYIGHLPTYSNEDNLFQLIREDHLDEAPAEQKKDDENIEVEPNSTTQVAQGLPALQLSFQLFPTRHPLQLHCPYSVTTNYPRSFIVDPFPIAH